VSDVQSAEKLPKPLPKTDSSEGILEVLERAAKGEEAMRPLVLELLDRGQEAGAWLMAVYGDVFRHAQDAVVKPIAGKDIAMQEILRRKISAVRDELAGPNATPLERILCERVALCWFDAHEQDRLYGNPQDGVSFKSCEYRESRRDRAHKRFLAACKTLATVRRLAVPAIQVNVARKQVNVAGSA
jgi:hypothetical protein